MRITVGKGKRAKQVPWRGAAGLADDIRYYGRWILERAWERIGHLYPTAKLPDGGEATVIAWLWARTVPCPNPACGVAMPLMGTFQPSSQTNNQHWTRPVVEREAKTVSFIVQDDANCVPATGTVNRNGATCLACNGVVALEYVREQARAGQMGEVMTGIVAEGDHKRLFLSPTDTHSETAHAATSARRPNGILPERALGFRVQSYGFAHWHQLFTERQLTGLTTLSDLLKEAHQQITQDRVDIEYANAICTYLSLAWRTHPPVQGVRRADSRGAGPGSGHRAGDPGAAGEGRTDAQVQDTERNCPSPADTSPGAARRAGVASPIATISRREVGGLQGLYASKLTTDSVDHFSDLRRISASGGAAGERSYYPPPESSTSVSNTPRLRPRRWRGHGRVPRAARTVQVGLGPGMVEIWPGEEKEHWPPPAWSSGL